MVAARVQVVQRLMVMVAAMTIAGCADGGAGPEMPKVATFSSAGSAPSVAPSAAGGPPRLRLDSTDEEIAALKRPYFECMTEHGANVDKATMKLGPDQPTRSKIDAADRVCKPRYLPLAPWEKDPANPEAKDFARDVVKCLKGKGIRYVETGANGIDISLGGPQNDAASISKGLQFAPKCERQVAAARK